MLALHNMEVVPQFLIPAEPETSWAGGAFYGENRFVIWTLVNQKRHVLSVLRIFIYLFHFRMAMCLIIYYIHQKQWKGVVCQREMRVYIIGKKRETKTSLYVYLYKCLYIKCKTYTFLSFRW
jgi:hypothetical protein